MNWFFLKIGLYIEITSSFGILMDFPQILTLEKDPFSEIKIPVINTGFTKTIEFGFRFI